MLAAICYDTFSFMEQPLQAMNTTDDGDAQNTRLKHTPETKTVRDKACDTDQNPDGGAVPHTVAVGVAVGVATTTPTRHHAPKLKRPDIMPEPCPLPAQPHSPGVSRSVPVIAILCSMLALGGCSMSQAPAFFMFGSYFPSWLVGTAVGIVLMIPLRWLLIRTGIDDALPLRLLFYVCLVLIIAMVFSYTFSPQ